uniref:Uncharacterized protein n=1 Tax=Esox lucius TaxID=8010 RepID=A0A6Q2YC34_ESOLU
LRPRATDHKGRSKWMATVLCHDPVVTNWSHITHEDTAVYMKPFWYHYKEGELHIPPAGKMSGKETVFLSADGHEEAGHLPHLYLLDFVGKLLRRLSILSRYRGQPSAEGNKKGSLRAL